MKTEKFSTVGFIKNYIYNTLNLQRRLKATRRRKSQAREARQNETYIKNNSHNLRVSEEVV